MLTLAGIWSMGHIPLDALQGSSHSVKPTAVRMAQRVSTESADASLSACLLGHAPDLIVGPRESSKLHRRSEHPIIRAGELGCLLPEFQRVQHVVVDMQVPT